MGVVAQGLEAVALGQLETHVADETGGGGRGVGGEYVVVKDVRGKWVRSEVGEGLMH